VIMLAPFSGPWLVCTTKVYPGLGADIVMESITLIDPVPNGCCRIPKCLPGKRSIWKK